MFYDGTSERLYSRLVLSFYPMLKFGGICISLMLESADHGGSSVERFYSVGL